MNNTTRSLPNMEETLSIPRSSFDKDPLETYFEEDDKAKGVTKVINADSDDSERLSKESFAAGLQMDTRLTSTRLKIEFPAL